MSQPPPEPPPASLQLTNQQEEEEWEERIERDRRARAHFPHLSSNVAPRESDEYPTFWED